MSQSALRVIGHPAFPTVGLISLHGRDFDIESRLRASSKRLRIGYSLGNRRAGTRDRQHTESLRND